MSHSLTLGYGGAWSGLKSGARTGHPLLPRGYGSEPLLINSSRSTGDMRPCRGGSNSDGLATSQELGSLPEDRGLQSQSFERCVPVLKTFIFNSHPRSNRALVVTRKSLKKARSTTACVLENKSDGRRFSENQLKGILWRDSPKQGPQNFGF